MVIRAPPVRKNALKGAFPGQRDSGASEVEVVGQGPVEVGDGVRLGGGGGRRLIEEPGEDVAPRWSADGREGRGGCGGGPHPMQCTVGRPVRGGGGWRGRRADRSGRPGSPSRRPTRDRAVAARRMIRAGRTAHWILAEEAGADAGSEGRPGEATSPSAADTSGTSAGRPRATMWGPGRALGAGTVNRSRFPGQ